MSTAFGQAAYFVAIVTKRAIGRSPVKMWKQYFYWGVVTILSLAAIVGVAVVVEFLDQAR